MEICGRMTLSASLLVLLLGLELLLPQAMAQDPERDAYARRMTSQAVSYTHLTLPTIYSE